MHARQGEHGRARLPRPGITNRLGGRRRRFDLPVRRKPPEFLDEHVVELDANGDIIEKHRRVQMDQALQRRQRFSATVPHDANDPGPLLAPKGRLSPLFHCRLPAFCHTQARGVVGMSLQRDPFRSP